MSFFSANQYINAYVYIYYNIFLFIEVRTYTVDSKGIKEYNVYADVGYG
ncbi:hypothetical protein [Clostridium folliculivorans]|uniref:Uncharacterized protein n=1 Tax=Clostridium folliculivorans TaxID=2886038 RepID=A0A9W6DC02_9CLOT|nr:hypothetical protein [Clostridium folliculivorans]GKU26819.1 hypothetical protein CFOLD11_36460 [Clostridium folliculivorans]GKU31413.1 hypothetical protein CFB3_35200 [Clostridium folliculivorans]